MGLQISTPAEFKQTTDAAGHLPLDSARRRRLSPAERNMHDHWFGRYDRQFSSHCKEFEMLTPSINSWQSYLGMAHDILQQKNPALMRRELEFDKVGYYDEQRNVVIIAAPGDGHLITMFRPKFELLEPGQSPDVLGPNARGKAYFEKMY